ncbi:YsnF/AvaK domain-containing protein [Noviherbaspirillum suwonense]|jgi:uncharacterized protein (TIGR02271 family)|uniref:Conserved domain-containing protein n=1 Tax=Noviherbaspirillum suwonense TaxID=1224511 RepID=A0ABY1QQE3_9BURK|nr:YsnF/AvaK domain-containing protein [Noviherbaspirillum suwonense]SMP75720.1 conserved domain-containing protein [Noviherbaspirillum suwonense]
MTQHNDQTPAGVVAQRQAAGNTLSEGETRVLPVLEEQLEIRKVPVETGAVRVRKIVHEENRTVDLTLMQEEVSVTRVPVNKVVENTFQPRQEGDTLVIPIFEEVVTRHLVLVEEVRITTRRNPEASRQQVTLKREEAVVERYDAASGSWKPEPTL